MRQRAILIVLALAICAPAAEAGAQEQQWQSYAVKFLCGNQTRGPLEDAVDGKYKTTINIHNPHYLLDFAGAEIPVVFFKKIVLAPHQAEEPQPPSCFFQEILKADHALSVNCGNIRRQLEISGLATGPVIDGFVVLLVPPFQGADSPLAPRLDVAAHHTARSRAFLADIRTNGVGTWEVEYIEPVDVRGNPVLTFCD